MTPKPYPNNPTDPTKPGEPTDPTTPNVPVIPYVPGYTPNVGGTPLVPKNPTDLTEGYTPPTPTDPKTNIEINYTPDPQKAVVKVYTIRDGVKIELPNEKVSIDSGIPDAAIPSKKLDEKIKDLEKRGYIVDNKTPLKGETFDKVKDSETGDPSQVYELILRERTSVETETKSVTRTIKYYKIDETNGSKVEVDNGKLTNTKTAEFTREVTTNLATGLTTIGEWSDKQTLDEVKTPVLTGYIADKVKVPSSEVTADTESFEEEVVYKKIGSWVPKVPGVEKPTPIPYPNDPNDPTKPKYPDYPTTPGNPGETPNPQPDTPGGGTPEKPNPPPVIPYVPGYTPKIGETPLQPKVPNDPTQGYIPPAVPTEPGTNTDITYVADPQKAVVKVFNTTTGTEVEIPAEKVSIDNGTTDSAIPTDSVTAKIADLEKRGYVVENKDLLNNQKFDKEKDPTDGDPTQVFKLLVKERTVTVTEPKNPNDPVDPDKPEGPKWPATGLAKSDLEKEVTRTITYVKKETANGPEIADAKPTVTQTAHFKRSATYNAVTGTITYGNWESADKELAKVDTPELTGYVADKASVEKVETNADSTGLDQKVVYTKLGSWVLTPPTGVTPPEGTNFDPKPYPNNPTDPTRPGEPEYPQPGTPVEPNTPVIPYVPGYTPKIPTDPTQPVDPNTNPLVPLTPVDPNHPENGYKVPPVPTKPGEDTPITYEGNPQKALVKVVKVDGTTETPLPKDNVTINGKTGDQIPTESVTAKIAELEKRGYVIDNRDEVVNYINNKFDKDKDTEGQDPTQTVTLKVHEKVVPVTPPTDDKPLEPGKPIDPDTPVDPNNPNDPTIPRWTDELIKKLDVKKEVTRTINYVDEAGNKVSEPSTDKVTFTREAKINVVTGEITYGDWKAVGGDSTFDKVSSPVVKGYILKDPAQKEVAERKGITPTVANQTIEVVYKKLGSWVPKVPGVETPTPLPYPNNPTDPTKPGDPTDPTTPNVPVIPYVPGYTPKTPDGNPLVPVDPNHPENGYKVPPVPTEPGQDTPIEYVKVPNTPSPEEPVKPTPESNHITIWVDENGKPLKPEKPGTHEPGNIPGYRYITTVTKDGVTIHKFEKITPVDPNNPVPQKPTTPIPTPQDSTIPTPESQIPTPNTPEANTPTSETNRREELPNTGTEANASLASAGIMTLLAGLGLGFFKKKEEDESE
ncbi:MULTISPECIES: LPXTG cell wall anchor domain-containing protein [unclassified Streptococcus]|uniref:mucin-binding protein n=1 Tax=unclassified Streptococcus TaxID=2608887 RepID=UPI001F035B95|nr:MULTISPECIES: LPXTG cell wall anchor domain-containing protein [unclassified Streptococcus]